MASSAKVLVLLSSSAGGRIRRTGVVDAVSWARPLPGRSPGQSRPGEACQREALTVLEAFHAELVLKA